MPNHRNIFDVRRLHNVELAVAPQGSKVTGITESGFQKFPRPLFDLQTAVQSYNRCPPSLLAGVACSKNRIEIEGPSARDIQAQFPLKWLGFNMM